MTFSGDHLESKTKWSKRRSNTILGLILFALAVALVNSSSRGYALMGIGILLTVMLHEAGHFLAAKWAKMKATEFFVGFGPRIWSFKKGETEYGIKAIPAGGYVKIIGMTNLEEVETEDELRTYRKGSTRKKLVVILAGVTVNVLLAYLFIFVALVAHGVPQSPSDSRAVIETVSPGSAADKAGLHPGDRIIRANQKEIPTFVSLVNFIDKSEVGDRVTLEYVRDGKTHRTSTVLTSGVSERGKQTGQPQLGVVRSMDYKRVGVLSAFVQTGKSTYSMFDNTIGAIGDRFSLSGLSDYSKTVAEADYDRVDRPSSILGIVNIGGQVVNQDIWSVLYLLAFINVFLAFINILPIIPLDGGHAVVAIYERIASKVKKREVYADYKKLMPVATVFVGILALFMLTTVWLDVLQIAN